MIGILVANSSNCKIYAYNKPIAQFTLTKEMGHEESHMKISQDLVRDDRGRPDKPFSVSRTAYEPDTDPKKKEWDIFAREVAHNIKNEAEKYSSLVLIVPPEFEGMLKSHINKIDKDHKVMDKVTHLIQKDLLNMNELDMFEYIREQVKYPQH
ncbi:host attachment protein [Rickettsiales endosymbiont of Stachyamoeba lipophora]|uniref:host attachment protein n=1 Tax=Rickettsiales endosymbiont of Stachyamoeba lipophora TaxID=2486578 RepID=UPI000F651A76|nr:host attachment protein [Rickettsiales endosymbiont of Stachyamoeba lipophora]AZL15204.1 hypothetical protein EF513_01340 [Rickettsiales endosymbiont of Stachyamoeba lipophora]